MRPPGIDTPDARHEELRQYVALELGLRFAAAIYSTIAVGVIVCLQAYGSAVWKLTYQYVISMEESQVVPFLMYLAVVMVMDIINTLLIEYCYYRHHGVGVFQRYDLLFTNKLFVIFTGAIATLLIMDLIFDSQLICVAMGPIPAGSNFQKWEERIYVHPGVRTRWYWPGSDLDPGALLQSNLTCVLA